MSETYVKVRAILKGLTNASAQLIPMGKGAFPSPVWIPRSLIHGGDDLMLAKALRNDEVKIRVMDWKARELGLMPMPAASQSEMDLS